MQVTPHTPFEQSSPVLHTLAQAPQFAGSTSSSTQDEPHAVVPPAHVSEQPPREQKGMPDGHTFPHFPQFAGSVCTLVQLPLQRLVPPPQSGLQLPVEHTSPGAHVWPHAPQLSTSVAVSTHAPPQAALPTLQLCATSWPASAVGLLVSVAASARTPVGVLLHAATAVVTNATEAMPSMPPQNPRAPLFFSIMTKASLARRDAQEREPMVTQNVQRAATSAQRAGLPRRDIRSER